MAAYREQYDRMCRWHARFAAIEKGRVHDSESDNYVDDVYAFFQNCYHLKDWLKNDGALALGIRNTVEGFVTNSTQLSLCADICNSLKHLKLLQTPRSSENPSFGKKAFALTLATGQPPTISLKFEVRTNSGPLDAFALATESVDAWKQFLVANNL